MPRDLDAEHAVAPGDRAEARRDDGGKRVSVGRLPRAQIGVDVSREREPEAQPAVSRQAAHAGRADPARVVRHGGPSRQRRPEPSGADGGSALVAAVLDQPRRRHEAKRDERAAARGGRDHRHEALRPRAVVVPHRKRGERAVGAPDERNDADLGPGHAHGEHELRGRRWERRAAQPDWGVRSDQLRKLRRRPAREVAAPAADPRERLVIEPEHGNAAEPRSAADAPALPQHRLRLDGAERPEHVRRDRDAHRDQLRDVLTHHVVGRHRECRLVPLAAHERAAVGLGEERKADRDDQEGGCDGRVPRAPCERERREPQGELPPGNDPFEQPQHRR